MRVVAGERAGGFSLRGGSVAGVRARGVGTGTAGRLGLRVPQPPWHTPQGADGGSPGRVAVGAPLAPRTVRVAVDRRDIVVAGSCAVRVVVRGRGLATLECTDAP